MVNQRINKMMVKMRMLGGETLEMGLMIKRMMFRRRMIKVGLGISVHLKKVKKRKNQTNLDQKLKMW
jgi:hypothetical protein